VAARGIGRSSFRFFFAFVNPGDWPGLDPECVSSQNLAREAGFQDNRDVGRSVLMLGMDVTRRLTTLRLIEAHPGR
jgi:hypothetical protein